MRRSLLPALVATTLLLIPACGTEDAGNASTPSPTQPSVQQSTTEPTASGTTAEPSAEASTETSSAAATESASAEPSSAKPTASATLDNPWANAELSTKGFGPITWKTTTKEITAKGWGKLAPSECTAFYGSRGALKAAGILGVGGERTVNLISTASPRVKTPEGVHVGMTEKELKAMIGNALQRTENGWGFDDEQGGSMHYVVEGGKVTLIAASALTLQEQTAPCGP